MSVFPPPPPRRGQYAPWWRPTAALFTFLLLIGSHLPTCAQQWLWARKGFGGNDTSEVKYNFIAPDPTRNAYFVWGSYKGANVRAGTHNLPDSPNHNSFIGRLDDQGQWQWVITVYAQPTTGVTSLAVDSAGDLYVTSYYGHNTSFIGFSLPPTAGNVFVGKLNGQTGSWLWHKPIDDSVGTSTPGAPTPWLGTSLFKGKNGKIYVQISNYHPIIVNGIRRVPYTVRTGRNSFATGSSLQGQLNLSGQWEWVTDIPLKINRGWKIQPDSGTTSMTLQGTFYDTLHLGGVTLLGSGVGTNTMTRFKAQLTDNGQWQNVALLPASDVWIGTLLPNSNRSVDFLYRRNPFTLGGIPYTPDSLDTFVVTYDHRKRVEWVATAAGQDNDFPAVWTLDAAGTIYLSGNSLSDTLRLGPHILRPVQGHTIWWGSDAFYAGLSPTGQWLWATALHTYQYTRRGVETKQVTMIAPGRLLVMGQFSDTVSFGTHRLQSRSLTDDFLALLQAPQQAALTFAPASAGVGQQIVISLPGGFTGPLTSVTFNGEARTTVFTLNAAGQIVVTVPPGALTGPVGVQLPDGSSYISTGSFSVRRAVTGVSERGTEQFGLFPNPARTCVRLALPEAPAASQAVVIVDAVGRTVRTQPVTTRETSLDLRGLPAGLYTVRWGTAARRLVIE